MSTKKYVCVLAAVAVLGVAIVFGMLGSLETGCAGPHTQGTRLQRPIPLLLRDLPRTC